MTDLAMVVITHNSADSIGELLATIPDAWPHGEPNVIVVDNGSTDATREIVEAHPGVRLVTQANLGYSAGVNSGVKAAPEAFAFLILNADLQLGTGCVRPLLAALGDGEVGIAVPRVLGPDGTLDHSLRRAPSIPRALGLNRTGWAPFSEYVTGDSAYRDSHDVVWALGAAMAFSRACYEQVGPWDESFFLYSEETDFCLRAGDAGWRTRYVPDSVITHTGGGSGRSDRTHMMLVVNRVRLYARRHPRPAAWVYWALNVTSELTWVVRGHRQSRASVRALLDPRKRPLELGCGSSLLPL